MKRLIVLVSKKAPSEKTDAAIQLLNQNNIEFDVYDISERKGPSLIRVSGIKKVFPQCFLEDGPQVEFLGEFEDLEEMDAVGALTMKTLGLIPEPQPVGSLRSIPEHDSFDEEEDEEDSFANDDDDPPPPEAYVQPDRKGESKKSKRKSKASTKNKDKVPLYCRWVPNSAVNYVSYMLKLDGKKK